MSYVALSQVRTLNGIALVKFEPKKLYANKRVDKETHVEHVQGHLYGFSDQKIYRHFSVLFLTTNTRYLLTTSTIV